MNIDFKQAVFAVMIVLVLVFTFNNLTYPLTTWLPFAELLPEYVSSRSIIELITTQAEIPILFSVTVFCVYIIIGVLN